MLPAGVIGVVDDEESVRKALGRLIRSAGFRVESHASVADFLLSLDQHRPDCILLDLHMPDLNGFQLQQALLLARVDVPVIVLTGDDAPSSRERALANGARAYLRKPVDEALLLDAIRETLRPTP